MAAKGSTATAAADAVKGGEEAWEEENGMATMAKVPFHGLFMYADSTDVVLMLVGMVGALANGMSMVVMSVIFGRMINAFGGATQDTVVHRVSKVCTALLQACNVTNSCCYRGLLEVVLAYNTDAKSLSQYMLLCK